MTEPARPSPERIRELAALRAAGRLSPAEEAELGAAGPDAAREAAAFERAAGAMAGAVAPGTPPPGARERFLAKARAEPANTAGRAPSAQPWRTWGASAAAGAMSVVRADAGAFQPTAFAGISVRPLFVDAAADRVTMLVRMEPGAAYPRHRHASAEECYVLQGDLVVGATLLGPGDYQRAGASSLHEVQSTRGGCLLFIVSSQHDELLAG